ncbi:MAG: cytochrome c oxidase, subunit [Cyanobacteria bacterium RYN_339]|nr:cytochrome c oxidase, subunit [Cyanobacteria bacterium RYN_339]
MTLNRTLQSLGLAGLALGCTALPAAASAFWFVDTVTPYGQKVDWLYQFMMWISIAILIVVEVALVAALIKFRKRPGENRQPETWSHNTKLEIIWTVIPFALLVAILIPTFQALAYLADVPKNPDLTLEVVGHQFYWEYRYPDLNVTFNSTPRDANGGYGDPLELPVGRKIKVIMTASDVIHAWWVPAFGLQQMTTPGNLAMVPLEITKAGDYTGSCAFLCGPQHGAMGIFVRAVDQPTFMAWADKHKSATGLKPIATVGLVGQTPPPPEANEVPEGKENPQGTEAAVAGKPTAEEAKKLSEKGKDLYAAKCLGCHQPTGAGVPGVFPPLDGSEFVTGPDKALVEIIVKGKSGPIKVKGADYNSAMPPVGTGMSDEEVAAIATYVRQSWSNKAEAVGPAMVKAKH